MAPPKVVVVMPAYNAGRTLKLTYEELPKESVNLVILVDDGSRDQTLEITTRTTATGRTRRRATRKPSRRGRTSWSWSTPTISTIRPSCPR